MIYDEQQMQELITSVNALRESIDALTDAVCNDEDRVSFEPDFALDDTEVQ